MASARLRKLAGTIFSEYNFTRRHSSVLILVNRTLANKSSSLESNKTEAKLDVPLKYTGSKAQAWRAEQSRSGNSAEDEPWYQPYVISLSLAVFLIYFCILREESDVDEKFDRTLYDHIEGLEERQVEQAIEFNRKNGIDTKALEERLKELRG